MCPGPSSWEYLMWRGFVGSCWLGPGCPVLRADTWENPVGKNGVMTPTRPTGKHLSIPTLLFSFERSDWLLPFLCPLLFLVCSCFYFRALLYVLWCITYLTSMLVRKNAFTPRNMCMPKWAFAGTHEHICVLRSTRDERCEFFETQYLLWCLYIFFLGHYVVHLLYIFFLFFFFLEVNILKIKG